MSPMEQFSTEGFWWLPDARAHRVPGTLTSDADGVHLALYGPLRPFAMSPGETYGVGGSEWTVTPVVHGRLRDMKDVTLVGVSGDNLIGPFDEVREVYRADLVLHGWHASADAFTEVWAEFDWLDAWLDPPSIVSDKGDLDTSTLREAPVELASAQVEGDTVRFISGVRGKSGPSAVHLDRWSALAVKLVVPLDWKSIVERRIRPIHDLLTVALGRPVRLTKLHLRPVDTDRRTPLCEGRFDIMQAAPASRTRQGLDNYAAPTLLKGNDSRLPLDQLLPAWFDLWERNRDTLVLLLAHFYAPFMYSDHKFATMFQALEALHRSRFEGRELDRSAHAERVTAITEAAIKAGIDAEMVQWAEAVLKARNDKRLSTKIDELVRATGSLGATVLAAAPSFSTRVARTRTGVSHGGAPQHLDTAARHWHGEVLQWIARTLLLTDVGVDDVADRVVDRAGFRYTIDQIRETVGVARP